MKRFFTALLLLALLGGGIYAVVTFLQRPGQDEKQNIRTDTVKQRDIKSVVNASGEVLPLLSSVVKSEISGRIQHLHAMEGEAVTRGQLLAELDRTSLLTREREAERNLESEQLRLEKARRNFKRLQELHQKEFVGEQEFLDAQTDYQLAELNIEIAQARLEDTQEDIAKTSILAPHDGIITLMNIVESQVISGATSVNDGTEMMTISQLEELYLEASINEVDVEKLALGKEAKITFDAIPNFSIEGKISVIAASARRDGNIRVFPIEVIFEVADTRVRPGISASVEIPVATASDVPSVILSAVFNQDDGSSYVFLQQPDGWEQRSVEVGINNLQYVEIKSGLAPGDVVALSRPAQLRQEP
ncbi:MAG: efflux RND transporter periplasmic adaptor subunit [Opitutales bacterium]